MARTLDPENICTRCGAPDVHCFCPDVTTPVLCCRLVPLVVANAAGATHTNCPEPVVWYSSEFNPDYPLAYCAEHAPDHRQSDGSGANEGENRG